MAVYFLNLKTFGRSGGSSAVSAAAYRSGERIRDERTGRTYDHTDRQDVLHKEILLPGEFAGADLGWARDRAHLWNSAESAESRRNARVAREYLVALPVELDAAQRLELVRGFSRELTDRYRFALDLTVHEPRRFPGSDPRNFHAHLLATTREVAKDGLAAKTTLELNDAKRRSLGLEPAVHELIHVRERWAEVTNAALRDANVDARVDHRSLAAQGIDREPYPYIPRAAYEMERHGYRSHLAERMRAEYQARVAARSERTAAVGQAADRGMEAGGREAGAREAGGREAGAREAGGREAGGREAGGREAGGREAGDREAEIRPPGNRPRQTLEEIRRQAREDWLRMKQDAAKSTSVTAERARDDDLSR